MNVTRCITAGVLLWGCAAATAMGQTSSLGEKVRRARESSVSAVESRESPKIPTNAVYSEHSWISVPPIKPRTYRVGDLITIIVREVRDFEAEADAIDNVRMTYQAEVDAFLKFTGGGIGAAAFRRGKPTVDYNFINRQTRQGDSEREDSLTMRLSGTIIDVKPNGVLVIEAKARIRHDEELSVLSVTGSCRKEDITADNTILSTQVADKTVSIKNVGSVRAATSRGWALRLLDWLKPV